MEEPRKFLKPVVRDRDAQPERQILREHWSLLRIGEFGPLERFYRQLELEVRCTLKYRSV